MSESTQRDEKQTPVAETVSPTQQDAKRKPQMPLPGGIVKLEDGEGTICDLTTGQCS